MTLEAEPVLRLSLARGEISAVCHRQLTRHVDIDGGWLVSDVRRDSASRLSISVGSTSRDAQVFDGVGFNPGGSIRRRLRSATAHCSTSHRRSVWRRLIDLGQRTPSKNPSSRTCRTTTRRRSTPWHAHRGPSPNPATAIFRLRPPREAGRLTRGLAGRSMAWKMASGSFSLAPVWNTALFWWCG